MTHAIATIRQMGFSSTSASCAAAPCPTWGGTASALSCGSGKGSVSPQFTSSNAADIGQPASNGSTLATENRKMRPTASITVSVGGMPQRGQAPGLKWGRQKKGADRPLPYWYAAQVRRELHGFPDKCIPLPPDADAETLSRLCQQYTARLLGYLDEIERGLP